MDRVFSVYLYNEKHYVRSAELSLPATPYQVLDALDKLRLKNGDSVHLDVDDYGGFQHYAGDLKGLNVFALNTLAEKLAKVNDTGELVMAIRSGLPDQPPSPDYTILLELALNSRTTHLKLPAEPLEMDGALDVIHAADWNSVSLHCLDCAVPALIPHISERDNIAHLNRLAGRLAGMDAPTLVKFKAVLDTTEDYSVLGATHIADTLRDYLYEPIYAEPEDMARYFLECSMGVASRSLIPFVDLAGYGQKLLEEQQGAMTEYGMVSREDGQSLKTSLTPAAPTQRGMEGMKM